jgi:hypothetical protein
MNSAMNQTTSASGLLRVHPCAAAFWRAALRSAPALSHVFGRLACAVLLFAAFAPVLIAPALACACCSERGWRIDASFPLSDVPRTQIDRMRFANRAVLSTDENDDPNLLDSGMSSEFALTVTRTDGGMTFAFRDPTGRAGTLRFAMPKTYWNFQVDPFGDAKDEGLGPSLYKEWRLTANVTGDGVFRRAAQTGQKVTLIFHGRGRGCTEAEHFTHWSLLLHGPAGKLTLYGALETP